MFVIAGVTGNTGSVVADTLLAAGQKVRVLVRDAKKGEPWAAKGAEVRVLATFTDEAGLADAFEGAEAAYLLSPPSVTATDAERRGTIDALARAVAKRSTQPSGSSASSGAPFHVVFLSSVGGQHPKGTGPIELLHYAEEQLAKTNAKLTFVRAAYFLENWAAVVPATKEGKLVTFLPADLRIPMVATRDIGAVAAKALLDGPPRSQAKIEIIELAGSKDLSSREVAALFGKLLGKNVEPDVAPLTAVVPAFSSFGIPEATGELYRQMYEGIENGTVAWEGKNTRFVRGTVDPEQILRSLV